MENKYYPLHCKPIGDSNSGEITTQVYIEHLPKDTTSDTIIASVIPLDLARQLVDAYNEKYGPQPEVDEELVRELTPQAVHEIIQEHERLIKQVGDYLIVLSKKPIVASVNRLIRALVDCGVLKLNEMPRFTVPEEPLNPSIDEQIDAMEQALDHFKVTRSGWSHIKKSLLHLKKLQAIQQVDVVKVIEDLVETCKGWAGQMGYNNDALSNFVVIQNAEAALGHLQAVAEPTQNFHKIGDSFIHHYTFNGGAFRFDELLLCLVGENMVALVNTNPYSIKYGNGKMVEPPVYVKDTHKISDAELMTISGGKTLQPEQDSNGHFNSFYKKLKS